MSKDIVKAIDRLGALKPSVYIQDNQNEQLIDLKVSIIKATTKDSGYHSDSQEIIEKLQDYLENGESTGSHEECATDMAIYFAFEKDEVTTRDFAIYGMMHYFLGKLGFDLLKNKKEEGGSPWEGIHGFLRDKVSVIKRRVLDIAEYVYGNDSKELRSVARTLEVSVDFEPPLDDLDIEEGVGG